MKKYINMIKDVFINIISSASLIAVIQLIIFPTLSRSETMNNFGVIVTIYGISNVIVTTMGNGINNIRLILDEKIKGKGNFNNISLKSLIVSLIVSSFLYGLYNLYTFGITTFIITVIFTLLGCLRAYLIVFYRLNINYKNILISNIYVIIGLLFGVFIYNIVNKWAIIFLFGEVFGVMYLLRNTPYKEEGFNKDNNYDTVFNNYKSIVCSNGIANSLVYLDRFFITPVLGSSSMAVYYSVNVMSKFIAMIITPFTNVLLTYINKMNKNKIKKKFIFLNIIVIITFIPMYFFLNFITPILVKILYPDVYSLISDYVRIVNLSTLINLLSSIITPFTLKFVNLKYQIIIQFIYGLIYVGSALLLSSKYGLLGFCFATLIGMLAKWIMLFTIGITKINSEESVI